MTNLARAETARTPQRRWGLFDEDFDRVFEGFFRPLRWVEEATSEALAPAMDIIERENEFVVRADLPGVKKEDIDVTLENGVLTISAESRAEAEQKGEHLIRRERHYGRYMRSLRLGTQVDAARIKAQYKDGVLELVLPKVEEVKPKKISVDVA
jgi:HSP20 family protein